MDIVIAVLLFGSAVGIHLWLRKRQFSRTNASGVEEYGSFGASIGESVIRFVGGISMLALCLAGAWVIAT